MKQQLSRPILNSLDALCAAIGADPPPLTLDEAEQQGYVNSDEFCERNPDKSIRTVQAMLHRNWKAGVLERVRVWVSGMSGARQYWYRAKQGGRP